MKKYIIGIIIILTATLGVYFSLNQKNELDKPQKKIKVATTIFPLYDITKNIAGDNMEVINILPPGGSPHTFEITPSLIKNLQGAKIIFNIGDPLDNWITKIGDNVDDVSIYSVKEGIDLKSFKFKHKHEHEKKPGMKMTLDPHYWLSIKNAKIIAENITKKIISIDPDNKLIYENNLDKYKIKLTKTKNEIDKILENVPNKKLIVFHESWNYFAYEFNLDIVGVFINSPGKEPTPQYLKELHDTAKKHNIQVVFSEPQLSPETIKPFVEDLNLSLYILDPLGGIGERNSFINTLLYNAKTINNALK